MSEGVTTTMELILKPGMGDAFLAYTQSVIEETARYPGFRAVRIVRHKDSNDHFLAIESWDSEEDYLAYLAWRAEQGVTAESIDMFAEPPIMRVWPTEVLRR